METKTYNVYYSDEHLGSAVEFTVKRKNPFDFLTQFNEWFEYEKNTHTCFKEMVTVSVVYC